MYEIKVDLPSETFVIHPKQQSADVVLQMLLPLIELHRRGVLDYEVVIKERG